MTFPGPGYFDCESFELLFRLHIFGGFWPLETSVRWKQILFAVFSFLSYFSLTSMLVIQVVDIYLLRNDPVELTKDLCSISIAYVIVIKSHLILYKVDSINRLKDKFSDYKNTRTDPAHIDLLEKSNRNILLVLRTLYVMAFSCALFWTLYPSLDAAENHKVPFPYRLPVDEWTYEIWLGLYVYQSFAMVGYMINLLGVDSMFCGFMLRINAHYDIIIENLERLGELEGRDSKGMRDEEKVEEETALMREVLRENVELHKDVLRDIKALEEIYSPSSFVHIVGVTFIIGTAIIDFVRIAKKFRFQILQKLLYVACGLWDAFLYCYYANKMQEKSLALSSAVYGVPWYHMKPELRRDLMFISYNCQKAPRMKVAHLFNLDLKTFVGMLKISYDITALLFRLVKE